MTAMTRSPGHGHLRPLAFPILQPPPCNSWLAQSGDSRSRKTAAAIATTPRCDTATKPDLQRTRALPDGMKAARAIWQNGVAVNMSRHQRRQRSIVQRSDGANDQSESSSPDPVTSQSAPRSQRGRRGVQESAAAVASRGFRLLKIRSGATTYGLINHAALSSPEISGPIRSQTQIRFGGEHP